MSRDGHGKSKQPADRRLELLIDSVRDYAIFMLDPRGKIESWNLGAELIKGYKPDEIIGSNIERFYTSDDVAAGRPAHLLAQAREQGRIEDEGWRIRKDGTRFWADVVITAVRDDSGELIGFLKVTRDLTERRHAEQMRIAQEHRFRLLVESAREYAIFMLDPQGLVMTWNEGAERIKGYRPEEIIGRHFSLFYAPEDVNLGKCDRELAYALVNGRFEEEGWRIRKDGSRFWASVVLEPLHDQAGTHVGFSKITRDLTPRLQAEQERLQLAHTQEALRLRDEFFSIAAHELRTPLAALQLQVDSLRAQATNFEQRQISKLDRAARNVQRLSELITSLLDVSRIAKGKLVLTPRRFDLGALIHEVVDRMQEPAVAAGCEVSVDARLGLEGNWDPLRIGQVIANLLSNAFKYARGSKIDVTLDGHDDEAIVCVADRGPGIPREHLENVFQRFERAAPSGAAGMGLGLYVAREIVNAHGGTIVATNRDGGGASLEVRLPLRDTQSIKPLKAE